LKNWTRLEKLNLHGARVTSKVFEHLAGLRELRDLDLGHTEITDDGFDLLAELPKLERLVIGGNRLSGQCLEFLKEMPSLRDLDVSGTQRVDSGLWGLALTEANLARIGALSQLRRLSLAGATISDRGVDKPGQPEAERVELRDLSALSGLVNLEYLDLSRQPVTAETLRTVAALPKLNTLRLGLCKKIDDSAVDVLLGMKALKHVAASGSGMTSAGMARLAHLQ
jgi:Leucine-rich repeat (LRR) protein